MGAANSSPSVSDVIFPWAQGGFAKHWGDGLVRFLLGVAGALVTAYLFLGDFLPSMGGKVDYDLQRGILDDLKKRKEKTLALLESYVQGGEAVPPERLEAAEQLSKDFETTITRMEASIAKDRWRLFRLGFPVYILLGGFFATAFATNLLQAILIGFGWTAVADRIGLNRELDARKAIKDDKVDTLEKQALEFQRKLIEANARVREAEAQKELATRAAAMLKTAPPPPSPPS